MIASYSPTPGPCVSAWPPVVAWSTSCPASRRPREMAVRSCLSSSANNSRMASCLTARRPDWRFGGRDSLETEADRLPARAEQAFALRVRSRSRARSIVGGSAPCKLWTKKSHIFRSPYAALGPRRPPPCSSPGITSRSNVLFALISAFTTCMVDDGSTLVSSSGSTSRSLPCSLCAWTTLELASYSGPIG